MSAHPQELPLSQARRASDAGLMIALVLLEGFDRHYRIFRECGRAAKRYFEAGDWLAVQSASRERIDYYDQRVLETVARLETEFNAVSLDDQIWQQVKMHYIGLLHDHKQPECAETFFNSVCCRILHRSYFHNRFLFVRPAISTEHIYADPPSYRCYYPSNYGLRHVLIDIILDFDIKGKFADFHRDMRYIMRLWRERLPRPFRLEPNHQIQVLSSLFFRNKCAYIVGKVVNGGEEYPFAVPILHDKDGNLYIDTVLVEQDQLVVLFSANRAYFLVDMEVPSTYVQFLRSMMPTRPKAELYTILGLQKQGKTLFYRDFLHHLKHSRDEFIIAPGIKGLVMCVFTLPSFPYVFKIIRDVIARPKEVTAQIVKKKYQLVKHHDRVGRMADTLEYSDVAFPKDRFTSALLDELRTMVPSQIEETEGTIIVKHLYIERRLAPLNIFLDDANDEERKHAIREYGNALKELAAANIFAGDLLFKNFGVTRYERVVFYDYDEVDYLTHCNFRRIPPPNTPEDELSAEPWYSVGPYDIFPEEFGAFLLTNPRVRECFMEHHADLLDADYWKSVQKRVADGYIEDFFPYPAEVRFCNRFNNEV
ncbi:MAG TPA: bifunctional isocitrate dehydrogenase kinase/phosphatase [Burkholderiales bacterium]|nr:bifunctional isocitrate dehydrogenase kinase/phosphatase [Burkholderiales bacterium]